MVNGKEVQQRKRAQSTVLQVTVDAYRAKEYLMREVPLPSGVIVRNKQQMNTGEGYIAYQKDKVICFVNQLAIGCAIYNIDIEPVFAGTCVMPVAKASMMYCPFVYGNNENKNVVIQ